MNLREAAQQALEALEVSTRFVYADLRPQCEEAITALKASLAEPTSQDSRQVEPVGYFSINSYGNWEQNESGCGTPLYEAPPKREPLTEEKISAIDWKSGETLHDFARAIERAHGIGGEE